MAALPSPADDVLFTPGLWVPLAVVDRVHVLPGIPRLFQSMVTAHAVSEGAGGWVSWGCQVQGAPCLGRGCGRV
jgi:molybdopterin-biosynthesis enzyme MoeA-like protein